MQRHIMNSSADTALFINTTVNHKKLSKEPHRSNGYIAVCTMAFFFISDFCSEMAAKLVINLTVGTIN